MQKSKAGRRKLSDGKSCFSSLHACQKHTVFAETKTRSYVFVMSGKTTAQISPYLVGVERQLYNDGLKTEQAVETAC
jgi:hypothetical protein